MPPPGAIAGSYTLVAGDFPGLVAEMFGVTVAELNAVNLEVNGYGGFIVGTEINIPTISASTTTTTTPDFAPASTIFPPSTVYGSPCSPLPVANFRCSGESLASGDGWTYFEYCEALKFEPAPTWPATPEQIAPTTYICVELPIVTLPPPATTTTIFGAC